MSEANTRAVAGPVDWVSSALERIGANDTAVLVMVTEDAGSTPRDAGAWILASREGRLLRVVSHLGLEGLHREVHEHSSKAKRTRKGIRIHMYMRSRSSSRS